jgi:NAD+ synthase
MSSTAPELSPAVLEIDAVAVADALAAGLQQAVRGRLRKRGAVVALSGGIDSSVVVALSARALGPDNVLAVLMPERDSAEETLHLSRLAAESQGVATELEDVTEALEAVGAYRRRDEAFRDLIPEYGPGWKAKIVLPPIVGEDTFRVFSVVARSPSGDEMRVRVTVDAYRRIVAATNFKQRVRKMLEYYHADRLDYAVAGTPNRLEHDLGFFVKNGDGSADAKPIAGLYKSQVYELASAIGVPEEIVSRTPTTDTYPLAQDQQEFYFALPYEQMDLALYARTNGYPPGSLATALDISLEDAERIYRDIDAKRRVAEILHLPPLTPTEGANAVSVSPAGSVPA